ncbi:hypothetical protein Ancab_001085 [Ancistrocladus abbreviatus]
MMDHNDLQNESWVLDVAVSLAKVADVDRALGNEGAAIAGFCKAIDILQSLTINSEEASLKHRVGIPVSS